MVLKVAEEILMARVNDQIALQDEKPLLYMMVMVPAYLPFIKKFRLYLGLKVL